MKIKACIIVCSIILFFGSCINKVERDLIGSYHVYKIGSNGTDTILLNDSVQLELLNNSKFVFNANKIKITGRWEAGDNGNFAWIKFKINGRPLDGLMGKSYIKLYKPYLFDMGNHENVEFIKN
jgi:hypothetical protein